MIFQKQAHKWLLVFIFLWGSKNPLFAADVCPDFKTRKCLASIQTSIDDEAFESARLESERQCWASLAHEHFLPKKSIYYQAAGCFFQASLERFQGNYYRSFEAKEKGLQMAQQGCRAGMDSLCTLLVDFFKDALDELLDEFEWDLTYGEERERFLSKEKISLNEIRVGREFPREFAKDLSQNILFRLEDRLEIEMPLKGQKNKIDTSYDYHMSVVAFYKGAGLYLDIKVYDKTHQNIVWHKQYSSEATKIRYKLMAFEDKIVLKRYIQDTYEPVYQVLGGLGHARLPNLLGNSSDDRRYVANLRISERFNGGHTDFGLMLSWHMTENQLNTQKTSNPEQEDTETQQSSNNTLKPYGKAVYLYAVLGHKFFEGIENFQNVRWGFHLGGGMFLSSQAHATIVRGGLDIFLGRRFVVTLSQIYQSKPELLITPDDPEQKNIPASQGAEALLSWSF